MDYSAEAGFTLNDDIGHPHLAAEGGEEDDKLDGVDIMSDGDERSLLGLDEGDDVVQTIFDEQGLLGVL